MTTDNILLALLLISVILAMPANRLMELVKIMAFQGVVVSLVPLFIAGGHKLEPASVGFVALMLLIKGFVMPMALYVAVKKVARLREVEPIVGYQASVFIGLFIMLGAVFISHRLTAFMPLKSDMMVSTAVAVIGAGFFLMMARRKAITQVIGYLMLENGIYLIGTALTHEAHSQYILEFGVLLDILAGVMIMGIILHRISRTFDDVDTGMLGSLKD